MTDLGNYISLETILNRMTDAAGRGDMQAAERLYHQAVEQAAMAYGATRAPFAVICMCQALYLQRSGQMLKAEAFNSYLRNMLMARGGELSLDGNMSVEGAEQL